MNRNILTLRDGKFWRNGQIEPPEIGNTEQIELLKKQYSYFEKLKESGLELSYDIEITYTAHSQFNCQCGKQIFLESDSHGATDRQAADALSHREEKTCRNCDANYLIYIEGEKNGKPILKAKLKQP